MTSSWARRRARLVLDLDSSPSGQPRAGIVGEGGPYTVKAYTGVRVDRGRPRSSTSPVSELTVEAPSGITEERDW